MSSSLNQVDSKTLRIGAEKVAVSAGQLLREKWLQPRRISRKGFRDWVTDADYAAQELIITWLRSRFPDSEFLAEEQGDGVQLPTNDQPDERILWIVDPLDGTSNYGRQLPIFCVSIAAAVRTPTSGMDAALSGSDGPLYGWNVLAGAIYDPMRDELFSAAAGQGSLLNGRPLNVSAVAKLSRSILGFDWGRQFSSRQKVLEALGRLAHQVHTIRAIGSAALGLAWTAAGRLDVYFNLSLSAWDAAAGDLLIREAGGTCHNLQGEPWRLTDLGCLSSNGLLHEEVFGTLTRFVNPTPSQ